MNSVNRSRPELSGKQQLVVVLGVLVAVIVSVISTAYTTASIFQKEPITDDRCCC